MYKPDHDNEIQQHLQFKQLCKSVPVCVYENKWSDGVRPFGNLVRSKQTIYRENFSCLLPNGCLAIVLNARDGFYAAVYEQLPERGLFTADVSPVFRDALYDDTRVFQINGFDFTIAKKFINNNDPLWNRRESIVNAKKLQVYDEMLQNANFFQEITASLGSLPRRETKQRFLTLLASLFNSLDNGTEQKLYCKADFHKRTKEGIRTALVFYYLDQTEELPSGSFREIEVIVIPVDLKTFVLREMEFGNHISTITEEEEEEVVVHKDFSPMLDILGKTWNHGELHGYTERH